MHGELNATRVDTLCISTVLHPRSVLHHRTGPCIVRFRNSCLAKTGPRALCRTPGRPGVSRASTGNLETLCTSTSDLTASIDVHGDEYMLQTPVATACAPWAAGAATRSCSTDTRQDVAKTLMPTAVLDDSEHRFGKLCLAGWPVVSG